MINKRIPGIAKQLYKSLLLQKKFNPIYVFRCSTQLAPAKSESKEAYKHCIGSEPLVYRSVGQELERAANLYTSREAIVSCHEEKRYTFSSLLEEVDRLAAGFRKLGLKQNDPIGIWAPNNTHWYLTMLAATRAGLISVGLNPAFQGPEIEYCLKKVNIKALVAPETFKTQNFYEILKSICPEIPDGTNGRIRSEKIPSLQNVIIDAPTNLKGVMKFDDVLGLGNQDEVQEIKKIQDTILPDFPCNIQFTSGTTGHPKATVLSHNSLVNNGIHVGNRNQLDGQRICVQVPLFHAYGVVISIMAGMSHGATLVLPSASFKPKASLEAIVNEKCSVIHGTPTMYVDLIKKQKELNYPITTAKMAVTGGAACSPALFMDIKNTLGLEHVRTVFGMTELTAVIFQSKPGDTMEQILNTVGHLQDHVEAKVIDENGNTVNFGERGELCIRGYPAMLEYFDDEAKTKETLNESRWLRTGDQFVLQEDGYGRIVGRIKEMIIRGGENIFPKEIEDFLNSHPSIMETHVIGVPDERMGEEICAVIRLENGVKDLTQPEIKQYCKGKVAHFKVPRYVVVVDNFPKTTSGKIQKFKLQELYKQKYSKDIK